MSEISFEDLHESNLHESNLHESNLHESMEETSIPKVELVDPTALAFKIRGAQHLPCCLLDTHSVNEDFRSREDIVKLLADKLLPPKNGVAASNPPFRQFALCGVRSIRKTEVAYEFVQHLLTHFNAVFWIKADKVANLNLSYKEISLAIRLKEEYQ